MRKYFGTDGIRFIYNEKAINIIKRFAISLKSLSVKKIIIGHDSRYSFKEILNILERYIDKSIKLVYVGEIATPGICYLSLKNNCLGLMITASHNNYKYNGLKLFDHGLKLNDEQILKLEQEMSKINEYKETNNSLISSLNLKEDYIKFLTDNLSKSDLKLGFDLANGALSSYAKRLTNLINNNCQIINDKPDGYNINASCGALYPDVIQKYIQKHDLDYGFTYDGDADRVLLVSKDHIYSGDEIMYYFCKTLNLKKKTLVITPYSNKALRDSLKNIHYDTVIVPPGDENILEYLLKNKLSLGGENAGHFILTDLLPTGDGFLNSLILISLLSKYNINKYLEDYKNYPSKLINIQYKNKETINNPYLLSRMRAYKEIYQDELDFFIRLSGTENILRIYVCHKDNFVVETIIKKITTIFMVLDNNIITNDIELLSIDEKSTFEDNISINGNSIIKNSNIKNNVTIISSVIEDSLIGENSQIGPFSHIHKDSTIGKRNRIGNFTEIKKSITGTNTKAAHLCYIGDCIVGSDVNFGCGSIIANYDGKNKTTSSIHNNVFIGSNVNIISPVIINEGAYIAAGSTITKNIPPYSFVIGRNRETIKENKAKHLPYYNKNK